jgi:hypothetical protein
MWSPKDPNLLGRPLACKHETRMEMIGSDEHWDHKSFIVPDPESILSLGENLFKKRDKPFTREF